ncbi:glyoxysomal processing protease, glyoxysomal isoform X2 [Mercurialis annua]|uniref:glyoxysomal processing protease, glyoxysomal isoform X2 n=1 Tax=Mercurialis annua TaxID=3986 RepID=UPI00215E39AE|nr:glyoxysomal processing protease, glyoxysomal isoform X2 [Mercurialis annua]
MGSPDTVNLARNFAVMVRVTGPDPKGVKMRKHAFHHYNSGKTTLSASGMLLPDTLFDADLAKKVLGFDGVEGQVLVLVVTVASVVESFLSLQHRERSDQGRPEMIAGAQIDVMIDEMVERVAEGNFDGGGSRWHSAQLLRLVGTLEHGWEVGWSLASHDNGPRAFKEVIPAQEGKKHMVIGESGDPSVVSKTTTRIALLGVFLYLKDLPIITVSPSINRGDSLLTVGSPFGILSPVHFFNSLSMGSIANCYPARSSNVSLLMADIRCLPGMEGSPVFGECGHFIGILTRPLRQKCTGAEIQLMIPWEAVATACSDLLLKEPQNEEKGTTINKNNFDAVGNAHSHGSDVPLRYKYEQFDSHSSSPLPVEKVMTSICLITIDEGVWASGVLLNDQGLILTNAHLLEPWRFGKTTVNGGRNGMKSGELFIPPEVSVFSGRGNVDSYRESQRVPSKTAKITGSSLIDQNKRYEFSFSYSVHRNIRVRLDHVNPWIWCDAKIVYVSKGPLDVALLQLEYVPDQLCPIKVDFSCPNLGSKAYVIGHGLFGPRCGFSPSVCSGVVAKIVKVEAPPLHRSIQGGDLCIPAMLETTAAVHPGASGGAVINSEGHMIGLVTSNARHGGGTVIPHLNFSIPCALLAPIFEFARDMQDISLLQKLDEPNQQLSSVWALMPSFSPKPTPPLPNLPESLFEGNEKQARGSKFANFIAERDKILRSSTQLAKVESISDEIFPSKL